MELTDEEKKIFKVEDNLKEWFGEYGLSASDRIKQGILESYSSNSDAVKITYGYIKRILLEAAKKRNLVIQDDIAFDIDELLKQIIEVPTELDDFDVLSYKDYTNLEKYLKEKTKGKTSSELEKFLLYFNGVNGMGGMNDSFRNFMTNYIPALSSKINLLENEISEENKGVDDWDVFSSNSEEVKDPEIHEQESDIDDESTLEDWDDLDRDLADWESGFENATKNNEGEFLDESDIDWEVLEKEWERKKENNEVMFWNNEKENEHEEQGRPMITATPEVTDEELISFIQYINTYPEIIKCKTNGIEAGKFLRELYSKTKLQEFYSNPKFLQDFKKIMEHDLKSHTYYFHGTQDLKSADMIMKEGLGMMRESLSTTAYPEFSMDDVILYSRGFTGEIGSSAIVIIDEPCKDNRKEKIVKPLEKEEKIHFSPSGLQGLTGEPHYIVDSKYIVGYVDKENKAIIFNPRYYDYNRFQTQSSDNRPKHLPYSEERIAEGVLRFDQKELEVPDKQIDK